MPFTVSHVAAVIPAYRPLSRLHLFSAAVIGSMVPDFGLLLPDRLARWQTHSLSGLIPFCLPVGLCAYALTQWLIKPAVLEVLPDRAYARLWREQVHAPLARLSHWVLVASVLLLGAITHLVWDGFTHENARGVRMLPMLSDYGPDVAGHVMRGYVWLQLGSSVVGLAVVGFAVALWLYHAGPPAIPLSRRLGRAERVCWMLLYLLLPLLAFAWLLRWRGSSMWLTREAVDVLRAAALSLLLVSALLSVRLRWAPRLDMAATLR
jgi:hypothetical protein